MRPSDLPDFERPPLHEVVMSVQFASLANYEHVHVGLLWEMFASRYPGRVEYHQPLPPSYETFGLGFQSALQLQIGSVADIPRVWFTSASRDQILQFQRDRFIHNWRKVGEEDTYPRYETIRARFVDEYQQTDAFVRKQGIGGISPNQCELHYINIIKLDGLTGTDQTGDVFTFWAAVSDPKLDACEDVGVTARYPIRDPEGAPLGRLTAQVVPGIDQMGNRIIQFSLIVRGPPLAPSMESAVAFMDLARIKIVSAFAVLTTEKMHRIWGRKV